MTKSYNEDPRVVAIRNDLIDKNDPKTYTLESKKGFCGPMQDAGRWTLDMAVGRGSCSWVDECYSDEDLVKFLDEDNIQSPKEAVKEARKLSCLLWNASESYFG